MKKYIFNFNNNIQLYINELINDGKTIMKSFSKIVDYKLGTYYTYIPNNTSEKSLFTFNYALPTYTQFVKEKIKEYTSSFILQHLQSNPDAICISQGGEEQANDKWIADHEEKYTLLTYNKELYYLLNNKNSLKEIKRFIQVSKGLFPTQIIFLTYARELKQLQDKIYKLERSQINELAKKTDKMLINAYDFDGYIFWEKNTI